MKTLLGLVFALSSIPGLAAETAVPHAYSAAQQSAAVSIDVARRRIEASFTACIARAKDDEYRFSLRIWQVENLEVTLPADRVLATIDAKSRKALERSLDHGKKADAEPNDALCDIVSRGLRNHKLDYVQTDADAAQTLRAMFAADNALRLAKRDADLAVGCVKQRYNDGVRNFAKTTAECACVPRAIKANANDDQIDAWLARIDDPKAPQPAWFGKAQLAVVQCVAGLQ